MTCAAPLEDSDSDSSSGDEDEGGDAAAAAAAEGGGGEGENAPLSPPPPHDHHHHSHGLRWALASTLCVFYSVAVAALLPYFSSLMAVIASLGDLAGAYALPALFALLLASKKEEEGRRRGGIAGGGGAPPPLIGATEALLCRTLLIPGSLLLSAVGMVLSVRALLDDMEEGGTGANGGFAGRMRWWWK